MQETEHKEESHKDQLPAPLEFPPIDFSFDTAERRNSLCETIEGGPEAAYRAVQISMESYGLPYALLLAHRLDGCKGSTPVKNLHNDLYRWLDTLKQQATGDSLITNVFALLNLSEPAQLKEWHKGLSTMQLTDIVEKAAMRDLMSAMKPT